MATNQTDDLYETLKAALVPCPADLGGGSYLPQGVLNHYVTEPHVTACCREEHVPESLSATIAASAPKIFTILLLANKMQRVQDMLECGLGDQDLPLVLGQDKNSLVSCRGTVFRPFSRPWPRPICRDVEEILEKQWTVDSPILDDSGEHHTFGAKRVLPFMRELEPLGGGGKEVFDCTIHPGYFSAVDNHDGAAAADASGRRVAVKKFTNKAAFDREMEALRATRSENHPRLIRYLCTLEKSNTYYILLPWADGSTLNSFWENHDPQTNPRDRGLVRRSLDQLLQLTDALRCFHSLKFRHGDLKPDNILHFTGSSSGQVDNFVIADLGIARFHRLDTNLRKGATLTKSTTATYEAPEVRGAPSGRPLPRRYDIWSMGCIMLEYIIWLLWDVEAINGFAEKRDHPAYAFYDIQRDADSTGVRPSIVHPAVLECMRELRADPRCQPGTAMRDLIDLIENHLLVVDVNRRYDAAHLHAAVAEIVRKSLASGQGMGDVYVLPSGAEAPAARPSFFQSKAAQGGAGAPGPRQS